MSATSEAVEELARSLAGAMLDGVLEDAILKAARLEQLKRKEQLSPKEVEELYGIKVKTLEGWRCQGKGPSYFKDGGVVLYPRKFLHSYQESHLVRTTDQR